MPHSFLFHFSIYLQSFIGSFFISTTLIITVGYPIYTHLDKLISLTFNIGVEGPGSIRHGLVGIHSHRLLRLQLSGLEHHGKILPLF